MSRPETVCVFANVGGWDTAADSSEWFYIQDVMTTVGRVYDTLLLNPTDPDGLHESYDVVVVWPENTEFTSFVTTERCRCATLYGDPVAEGMTAAFVETYFDVHHRTHHWVLPCSEQIDQYPYYPGIKNKQSWMDVRDHAVLCTCYFKPDDLLMQRALRVLSEQCDIDELLVVGYPGVELGAYVNDHFNTIMASSMLASTMTHGEQRIAQNEFFDLLRHSFAYLYPTPEKRGASIAYAASQGVPVVGQSGGDYMQFLVLPDNLPTYGNTAKHARMAIGNEMFFAPEMAEDRYIRGIDYATWRKYMRH